MTVVLILVINFSVSLLKLPPTSLGPVATATAPPHVCGRALLPSDGLSLHMVDQQVTPEKGTACRKEQAVSFLL